MEDGSTVHVMEWPRSGGKHKDKRSQAEKKQVAGQESVRDMGPAIPESEIQLSAEKDEQRQIVACWSEGIDDEVEQYAAPRACNTCHTRKIFSCARGSRCLRYSAFGKSIHCSSEHSLLHAMSPRLASKSAANTLRSTCF